MSTRHRGCQGYRLVEDMYGRRAGVGWSRACTSAGPMESIDRALTLRSETPGLALRAKGGEMHSRDPATGRDLLGHGEEHTAHRVAESRAEVAEARIAELERQLRARPR